MFSVPPISPTPTPQPAPTPLPTPVSVPAPPPPPVYSQEQWEIIGIIETQVAKITTHKLDTQTQLPGWLAHFEPLRPTMNPWAWRQEMRRIAIVDGERYRWADAASRSNYSGSGVLWNTLDCESKRSYFSPDEGAVIVTESFERIWGINGNVFVVDGSETQTRLGPIPEPGQTVVTGGTRSAPTTRKTAVIPGGYTFSEFTATIGGAEYVFDFSDDGAILRFQITAFSSYAPNILCTPK